VSGTSFEKANKKMTIMNVILFNSATATASHNNNNRRQPDSNHLWAGEFEFGPVVSHRVF
jgi:hypothetical protein